MANQNADNFSTTTTSTGGTGISSATAYAPLIAGTTSTGPLQSTTGMSSSGSVLTSNGAGVAPSFISPATNYFVLISSQTVSGASTVNFTSGITNTYNIYYLLCSKLLVSTTADQDLICTLSTNGGSSYVTTGYFSGYINLTSGGGFTSSNSTAHFKIGSLAGTTSPSASAAGTYFFNMTNGANVAMCGRGSKGAANLTFGGTSGTASVNAIQIAGASGTITGVFTLFGILE
jgi:hypothetical protein